MKISIMGLIFLASVASFAAEFEKCHVRCTDSRKNFQHINHECRVIGENKGIEKGYIGLSLEREGRGSHNSNYYMTKIKDNNREAVMVGIRIFNAKKICFNMREKVVKMLDDAKNNGICDSIVTEIEDVANATYIGMSGDLDSLSEPCMHLGN